MQKVALVTGSSSGSGALTAVELARAALGVTNPYFGRLNVLLAKSVCRLRVILVQNRQGAVAD